MSQPNEFNNSENYNEDYKEFCQLSIEKKEEKIINVEGSKICPMCGTLTKLELFTGGICKNCMDEQTEYMNNDLKNNYISGDEYDEDYSEEIATLQQYERDQNKA